MAAFSFISAVSLVVVSLFVFITLILPRWFLPEVSVGFSGYSEMLVPIASTFEDKGILIKSAPPSDYCKEAEVIILPPGAYRSNNSFLTTALPGKADHCNAVPIEVVFTEPVRSVVVSFYGANVPYELIGYRNDGSVIRTRYHSSKPYDYHAPFRLGIVSGRANISRVIFGYESALTMIEKLEFSR